MTKKTDPIAEAQKRQAEIVAEQEKLQSAPPTPTQAEADRAKLGILGDEGFAPSGEPEEKSETADKPGSYKTRAASAN